MLEFQKEGRQSVHRVLLATDSLGMGVDLPDISRVVQWKVPKQRDDALEIMWQRFGRVARGPGKTGEAILLAEQQFWSLRETRKQGFKVNEVSVSDIEDSDRTDLQLYTPDSKFSATSKSIKNIAKISVSKSKTEVQRWEELPDALYKLFNGDCCL